MSGPTGRVGAVVVVFLPVIVLAWGCAKQAPTPITAVIDEPGSSTPAEVELSDAKVALLEDNLVQFEVKYRFTKGRPDRVYECNISFPGTPNQGVKSMQNWEMKEEGVIRDKIVLSQPGVKSFEIRLGEAPTARSSYKQISNVASGPVK